MNSKNKKVLSIIFKIAVLVLAFSFIYARLTNNKSLSDFKKLTQPLSAASLWIVFTVIAVLMLLNWFVEAIKWKYLAQRVEKISIIKAVESVFCGLTWAVFTPNRIGEYGGRVFFLSPRKRISGMIAMSVGAIGQMVITNVLGSLALLWFIGRFLEPNPTLYYALTFLTAIFCGFFLLFYFNISWVNSLLSRIRFLKAFKKFFSVLGRYKKHELQKILAYCLSRFIVFTTQYYLIIHLLIPQIQALEMIMMICILFFVQSALPSLDLLDIGVRAATATYFFSFITDQHVAIMAATACIWLVNLIIPAILGSVFILKLNFFGKSHH